jgi:hypothetical protein
MNEYALACSFRYLRNLGEGCVLAFTEAPASREKLILFEKPRLIAVANTKHQGFYFSAEVGATCVRS